MNPLTTTQSAVLHYLRDHQTRTGSMPTMAEIALHFHWKSDNAAAEHVHCLERKGLLSRVAGRSRGVSFTDGAWAILKRSEPNEQLRPSLLALPVVDPCRSRAPGHYRG